MKRISAKTFIHLFLEEDENNSALFRNGNNFFLFQKKTKTYFSSEAIPKKTKGWITGVIAYDWAREQLGIPGKTDAHAPSFLFREYETVSVTSVQEFMNILPYFIEQKKYSLGNFIADNPEEKWEEGFFKTQRNILEGEIYQMNLTRRFTADFQGNAKFLFLDLFSKNPSSHAAFFGFPYGAIVSASPELFLCFQGENVTTEPIKGTRPRGKDSQEDEKFRKELLESEKEKAELFMITDLLRNDLRQTCFPIRVESLRELQKNPSVWHTFSRISGKRFSEYSPIDTLLSCLPGGSISGCPKKRATELIEKTEAHARGIFCGTLGFWDAKGNGVFSLLIRTLLVHNKKVFFQAGGGITASSIMEAEKREIEDKSAPFFGLSTSRNPIV